MKSKRLKIAVIGPYRADTVNGIARNIAVARDAAVAILKRGHKPFTPHLNTAFMDGVVPDEVFLEMGRDIVEWCDAVFLLPGWCASVGAAIEFELASKSGKLIYSEIHDIPLISSTEGGTQ